MPVLFSYVLKLSCSLAVVYLFYQFVLRRLTFYHSNRWYLLGYSVLCFFIPLIDISNLVETHQLSGFPVVQAIPVLEHYTSLSQMAASKNNPVAFTTWDYALLVFAFGMLALLVRLGLQFRSYRRMRSGAQLLTSDEINLYQVNTNVTPFSFGSSIFINQHLHSESELQEIIRHEFVHVTQRHSIDIIWAEVLCIFNWYNPFAWLLRQAVRQNLEFIADDSVVQSGLDKRQYQYLLLKVLGTSQFSIAASFNFSSLKKRIVMMNKMKSAKAHLVKFLFALPLLAVLLLAFRSEQMRKKEPAYIAIATTDTVPAPPAPPTATAVAPVPEVAPDKVAPVVGIGFDGDTSLLPEEYKSFFDRNPAIKNIRWTERTMIVELKSGKKETYQRDNEKSMATAIKKWGMLPMAPPPPPPPMVAPPPVPEADTSNLPNDFNRAYQEKMEFLQEQMAQLDNVLQKDDDTAQVEAKKLYLQQRLIALQRQQSNMQRYMQENEKHLWIDQRKREQINQQKMAAANERQYKIAQQNLQHNQQAWERKQKEMKDQAAKDAERMFQQQKALQAQAEQMQTKILQAQKEATLHLEKQQEALNKKLKATHE